jgi:hypothetical protein
VGFSRSEKFARIILHEEKIILDSTYLLFIDKISIERMGPSLFSWHLLAEGE